MSVSILAAFALAVPAAYALGRWRGWERGFEAACAAALEIPGVTDMARQERYRRGRSANGVRRAHDAIEALGPSWAPAAQPPQGRPPARSEASERSAPSGSEDPTKRTRGRTGDHG